MHWPVLAVQPSFQFLACMSRLLTLPSLTDYLLPKSALNFPPSKRLITFNCLWVLFLSPHLKPLRTEYLQTLDSALNSRWWREILNVNNRWNIWTFTLCVGVFTAIFFMWVGVDVCVWDVAFWTQWGNILFRPNKAAHVNSTFLSLRWFCLKLSLFLIWREEAASLCVCVCVCVCLLAFEDLHKTDFEFHTLSAYCGKMSRSAWNCTLQNWIFRNYFIWVYLKWLLGLLYTQQLCYEWKPLTDTPQGRAGRNPWIWIFLLCSSLTNHCWQQWWKVTTYLP